MILAEFVKNKSDRLLGFSVKGHAGFGSAGNDIACASVSSAVMLTANTITEAFKIKAKVDVLENEISLKLENDQTGEGDKLLLGLLTHLYCLSDEFSGSIRIKVIDA